MENTLDYTFEVSLSSQKFDRKPDRETEVGRLRFYKIRTDIEGMIKAIANGYCYAPIFNLSSFGMRDKTDNNFIYSSFISIDIDHSKMDMTSMIQTLQHKPTIAYTSCNDGVNGECKYRFIYCFDEHIEGCQEYYNYVYAILEANHLCIDDIDKRSLKASQYYNGNGCSNCTINTSYIVYRKQDFIEYYKDYYHINYTDDKDESVNENHIYTPTYNMNLNDTFEDKQFEEDYWNMKMEDVIYKYVDTYPNIEHTPIDIPNDDTPYILFNSDYIEIRRYWRKNKDGRTVKIKDGEGRRHKLYLNGILRRLITPSITFDNLIYNLLYELVYYISNYDAENIIGKKEIFYIAKDVMKADMTKFENLKGTNRRYMVNPSYCVKYGMTKNQVKNIAAKQLRGYRIGELYDCELSDKENVEVMKNNGVKVSLSTLKRWRKDNGITKYSKNT